MAEELINNIPEFVSAVLKISQPHVWIDYDSEVDVLYISFQKPFLQSWTNLDKSKVGPTYLLG